MDAAFIKKYCIVLTKKMRISGVRCHLTYYTVTSVRKRGGAMETLLLHIIYLLFFGLVGVTIIAIALIIALVIILSK